MLVNFRKKEYGAISMKNPESGFSLVELIIVCVVLVIISAIAIPNIVLINRNYKLDAAGHSVASLLQQARMQAVKTNQPNYAAFDNNAQVFYVTTGDPANTPYVNGNPDVNLPGGISFQGIPANHAQLDAYLGGGPPQLGGSIGFNARGLPCTIGPGGNPWICTSATSGFEWFVQNANGDWEAITVTAAGRIKCWRLSNATNGTWQ
jgi:prepilin-type N-terminal cleavage/methylation domain-containing protein